MAHVGHGALIGRGTYRAWHIHGGKVSLTYESSYIYILGNVVEKFIKNIKKIGATLQFLMFLKNNTRFEN